MTSFFSAALLLLALPAASAPAPTEAGPIEEEAPAEVPDTAGAGLKEVLRRARLSRADARLVSISARTTASGTVLCDPTAPFQEGWRFSLYSKSARKFLLLAECAGAVAGPLEEMRDSEILQRPIEGSFIDSDEAMRVLSAQKVSLDPKEYRVVGKRPFSLKLSSIEDQRFPDPKPAVWEVTVGSSRFTVDAGKAGLFDPAAYGLNPEIFLPDEEIAKREANLKQRPKKGKRNATARTDYDKVMAFAGKKYPGSRLMAVESIVDSWGGSPCVGPGDGWAYYFAYPDRKDFAAIFSCLGDVGVGASPNIPVSKETHQPLEGRFVDSDVILDGLLKLQPGSMNEGLGRNYTRLGTLRLVNFKKAPFRDPALSQVTLFWVFNLGNSRYTFNARDGRLVDTRE
ncbi:MAG: hypothetical protein WC969_02805 [Elusimicrobiota bacterium]|jgi:hypothetical protein